MGEMYVLKLKNCWLSRHPSLLQRVLLKTLRSGMHVVHTANYSTSSPNLPLDFAATNIGGSQF